VHLQAKEAMDKLLHEMQERLANERSHFEEEKAICIARLESDKQEISKELRNAQKEVSL